MLSSLGKVLDLHVFQDEAGLLGEILQNLSEVHQLLDPRPARTESGAVDCQVGVNPDEKPENASLLLKLFLFPGNLDVKQLGSDNVQVTCIEFSRNFAKTLVNRPLYTDNTSHHIVWLFL